MEMKHELLFCHLYEFRSIEAYEILWHGLRQKKKRNFYSIIKKHIWQKQNHIFKAPAHIYIYQSKGGNVYYV